MFRSIEKFMDRISTGPLVILSIIIYVVFIAYLLPAQKAVTQTYMGDAGSIDMSFFLSPDKVYSMAEAYGEEGRSKYITARYTFDVIWPLAYTFFMITFITFCMKRVHGNESNLVHLNFAGIVPMIFDYIENGFAIAVMSAYPERMDAAVCVMAAMTALKWTAMGIANIILVYGLIALPVVLIRRRLASS